MLYRLLARLRTYKDHADSLNTRAEVETVLWNVAAGKRPMLTRNECRLLALKLGVPRAYQSEEIKRAI